MTTADHVVASEVAVLAVFSAGFAAGQHAAPSSDTGVERTAIPE